MSFIGNKGEQSTSAEVTLLTALNTLTPSSSGFLRKTGTATFEQVAEAGTGDVTGASSSVNNSLVRFDGTTGKLIQSSDIIITDSDVMTGATSITSTAFIGALTGNSDTVTGFTPASGSLTLAGADALTITTTGATNSTLPLGTKTLVATDVATLSSLTSIGAIATGTWEATDVAITHGGTGASSLAAANIPTYASTITFTNKRITPRVTTEASSATPTINTDNTDLHSITALATAITNMSTNLSGTPTNGQKLWSDVRTPTEISDNYDSELVGNEAGLVGYWKFSNNGLDETANDNDLTNNNVATFSSDVPFDATVATDTGNMLLFF